MAAVYHPLVAIIAAPLAGALLLGIIPRVRTGWILGVALLALAADLAMALCLAAADPADLVAAGYEVKLQWLTSPLILVHLGLDGLSLVPVVLTPLIASTALLAGWSEAGDRTREMAAGLLVLASSLVGLFVSLDLITYAFFLHVAVLALAHLIAGSGRCGDGRAATQLALVNLVGAASFLGAAIFLHTSCQRVAGAISYGLEELSGVSLPVDLQVGLFLAFFFCFALQLSLFPLHGWMIQALGMGSTTGGVALAGLWCLTGAYGLVRIGLSLFPAAVQILAAYGAPLGALSAVYGGLLALVQPDLRRRLGYANVGFSGLVLLGACTLTTPGVLGSALLAFGQGPLRALLFLLAIALGRSAMTGPEKLAGTGSGRMGAACWLAGALALVGAPAFSAFHGEVLILAAALASRPLAGVLALVGMGLVGVSLLYPFLAMARRRDSDGKLRIRVGVAAVVLTATALGGGLHPQPWVERVEAGLQQIATVAGLKHFAGAGGGLGAAAPESSAGGPDGGGAPGDNGER